MLVSGAWVDGIIVFLFVGLVASFIFVLFVGAWRFAKKIAMWCLDRHHSRSCDDEAFWR